MQTETTTPALKLKWEQSKFFEGCPIYCVHSKYNCGAILRIEYYLHEDTWSIEIMGIRRVSEAGTIHESDRIKIKAEQMLAQTLLEVQSLIK